MEMGQATVAVVASSFIPSVLKWTCSLLGSWIRLIKRIPKAIQGRLKSVKGIPRFLKGSLPSANEIPLAIRGIPKSAKERFRFIRGIYCIRVILKVYMTCIGTCKCILASLAIGLRRVREERSGS